jgi:hypothetical protein
MATDLKNLTLAGIQALGRRLNTDLAAVPAGAPQRPTIASLISQIQGKLPTADPPPATDTWANNNLKNDFAQLTPLLGAALGQITGACRYLGGCIQTTQDECTALGGTFEANRPCP